MECASCQASLPEEALFCLRCGTRAAEHRKPEAEDPIRAALRKALGQQYEIQRLLGKGGMGAVYLATEAALEREVAIKVLPPDRGTTKESRDRFRREARTAARLSHPNIVPLHTFGDVDGTLYFVMGYVHGESLGARLKREGRLPVEDARRILIELCEALDYAHKLGVIHRDIKPDNVLLEEGTGRALLTDFGVAKALGAGQTLTEVGGVLGTPQYMSPEQAQGKADIDHRSDLYSLGVMGYAMLAGRLPFEGATPGDIMAQHITKEAPTLSSLAPGVPTEIASALARCLAKDPNRRWNDGKGLKDALSAVDSDTASEEFEDLPKMFWTMITGGVALLYLGAYWLGGGDVSDPFPVLPSIVAVACVAFALGLALRHWQLRKESFDSSRIVGEILRQPEAWRGWYPRRYRRRGDLWDRLPPELRRARAAFGAMMLSAFLGLLPYLIFSTTFTSHIRRTGRSPYQTDFRQWPLPVLFLPLFGISLYLLMRWQTHARRAGLDEKNAARTIDTPTSRRSFWLRPELAALLLPEGKPAAGATAGPASPTALAAAVASIVRGLPESARALGSRADAAGSDLAVGIARLDKQILGLGQAFDAADGARLASKLAALEAGGGAGGENEEVRDILRRQLETVRGLAARIEETRSRRARRFDLLKGLELQALDLQASSSDPAKADIAASRMQGLLARINEPDAPAATVGALDSRATEVDSDAPTIQRS